MKLSWFVFFLPFVFATACSGQPPLEAEDPTEESAPEVPSEVDVKPLTEDTDIASRLTEILQATEWFIAPQVEVDEGVVFLRGRVDNEQHREWAARLAGKTKDVVAVVNRLVLVEKPLWDMTPAWNEVKELTAATVRNIPLILVGSALLAATWLATKWSMFAARTLFGKRLKSPLLRDVASRAVAIPVFLLGLYLILKISGLTRLAMTVLGGTGLLGLVVGFAFRDIAENFLASILISMQHPFAKGDMIKVAGHEGFVQSVNTRSTLLMTLDGNHVQIPNSTIYKETITNFSANPNARFDFTVGIGYDDSISKAQQIALTVLHEHPAVVDDPEPLVLVEGLGASTINMRIYFWVDMEKYSSMKVRSAVIRQVKSAFEQAGISMPDEAREVVFPAGVPVQMLEAGISNQDSVQQKMTTNDEEDSVSNSAEGYLSSEAADIKQQAKMSRSPEAGHDLLDEE